jgi:fructose-1,6-bisphosphatase/inositol monophosphatase family enzyme
MHETMTDAHYGALTAHAVGTLMKEAVRRAIVAIRAHRFSFETLAKNRVGEAPDFVTTADRAAQQVFVTLLSQWFPGFGIIAEEENLRVPCTIPGRSLWFTVDPLDGTRAFMRRQSHGIGTMISLVDGADVIAACVGDVMTSEVYAARPGDAAVHRVSEFGIAERLEIDPARPLAGQYLLRTQGRGTGSAAVHALGEGDGALFAGVESTTGSLGIAMARLWKGEVGGAVFGPFLAASPWDLYPVVGLSQRLGFRFYVLRADVEAWRRPFEPVVAEDGMAMPDPVLVVHESRQPELEAWLDARPVFS